MRKKKVWRYYCEYCKKSGCSGGHMNKHEISCVKNPNRICNMCRLNRTKQMPMDFLKNVIQRALIDAERERKTLGIPSWWYGFDRESEHVIDALYVATNGCPACTLAAISQNELLYVDFNFEEAKKEFWSDHNEKYGYENYEVEK